MKTLTELESNALRRGDNDNGSQMEIKKEDIFSLPARRLILGSMSLKNYRRKMAIKVKAYINYWLLNDLCIKTCCILFVTVFWFEFFLWKIWIFHIRNPQNFTFYYSLFFPILSNPFSPSLLSLFTSLILAQRKGISIP